MDIGQAEKPMLVFKGSVGVGETVKQVGDLMPLFDSKHQAGQASEQEETHLERKRAWHSDGDVGWMFKRPEDMGALVTVESESMHDFSSEHQPQSERRNRVWPSAPTSDESPVLCVASGCCERQCPERQTGKQ